MQLSRIHRMLGIWTILVCSIGFTAVPTLSQEASAVLKTKQTMFKAGTRISLDFEVSNAAPLQLLLHAAYGSTLLDSETGTFILPAFITKKRGTIGYRLFYKKEVLVKGSLEIMSNAETLPKLESYSGPPSCNAGGKEHTMQVVIATDHYDNPLPDSTAVHMKQQFLTLKKEKISYSKDLMAWTMIPSYTTAGRLLISSKVGITTSKEFAVEIQPSIAEDFQIKSVRKHQYADGHQITEFHTSMIKDAFGNTISNGTLVDFNIQNTNGAILRTQASTINGIAKAKIVHPDHQDTWAIKALIPGMAESNLLKLDYAAVLHDFEVHFNASQQAIRVGPLLSFMEQLIPDGAIVVLKVTQQGSLITQKMKTSLNGMVHFRLNKENYPSGTYEIQVQAMGVQKKSLYIFLE